MKLVSGHTYLRGSNGEVVPFSDKLAKASGYEPFVQEVDFVDDMQLAENLKPVAGKRAMRVPVVTDKQKEIQQLEQQIKELQKSEAKSIVKPQALKPAIKVQPQPIKKSFEDGHMDIRAEMNADLGAL